MKYFSSRVLAFYAGEAQARGKLPISKNLRENLSLQTKLLAICFSSDFLLSPVFYSISNFTDTKNCGLLFVNLCFEFHLAYTRGGVIYIGAKCFGNKNVDIFVRSRSAYTFYNKQLDFSSELRVANEILENEPKSCLAVA